MSLWQRVSSWFTQNAVRNVVHSVPANRIDRSYDTTPIVADRAYVRVWVVEMMLAKSREWFKDWQPAVNSLVRLKYADRDASEIVRVAAPSKDRFQAGRSILFNYPVLDLVPYRGGTLELEIALLAMKGDDYLGKVINAASSFAELVSTPLSRAITTAAQIKSITDSIFGDQDNEVHLGYHNTHAAMQAGYVALILADPNTFDATRLCVKNDQLCWGDSIAVARPIYGFDFMLLRIESLASRDDLFHFKEISELRRKGTEAFAAKQFEQGKDLYRAAISQAFQHEELINADKRVLVDALKHEAADLPAQLGALSTSQQLHVTAVDWSTFSKALPVGTNHNPIQDDEKTLAQKLDFPGL